MAPPEFAFFSIFQGLLQFFLQFFDTFFFLSLLFKVPPACVCLLSHFLPCEPLAGVWWVGSRSLAGSSSYGSVLSWQIGLAFAFLLPKNRPLEDCSWCSLLPAHWHTAFCTYVASLCVSSCSPAPCFYLHSLHAAALRLGTGHPVPWALHHGVPLVLSETCNHECAYSTPAYVPTSPTAVGALPSVSCGFAAQGSPAFVKDEWFSQLGLLFQKYHKLVT